MAARQKMPVRHIDSEAVLSEELVRLGLTLADLGYPSNVFAGLPEGLYEAQLAGIARHLRRVERLHERAKAMRARLDGLPTAKAMPRPPGTKRTEGNPEAPDRLKSLRAVATGDEADPPTAWSIIQVAGTSLARLARELARERVRWALGEAETALNAPYRPKGSTNGYGHRLPPAGYDYGEALPASLRTSSQEGRELAPAQTAPARPVAGTGRQGRGSRRGTGHKKQPGRRGPQRPS